MNKNREEIISRDNESTGNSEKDWEIFDVLVTDNFADNQKMPSFFHHSPEHQHSPLRHQFLSPPDPPHFHGSDHHLAHVDIVTTLRSELAALTYKRDRLVNEISDVKHTIHTKDNEIETLRSQIARQTTMISSLQDRLNSTEIREKQVHAKAESNHHTLHREKKRFEEKSKEFIAKIKHMEHDLAIEASHKEDAKRHLLDLIRKLSHCLGIEGHESKTISEDCIINRSSEMMAELHRLRAKLSQTTDSLNGVEQEYISLKSYASTEKAKLLSQIETFQAHNEGINGRCRSLEKDLHITKERLTESEVTGNKLREELRGLESRCNRIQSNLERLQSDRLQYLRQVANIINVPEPCETLIKDKLREITNHNQILHTQLCSLREQLSAESSKHKEFHEIANHKIKSEETHRITAEERIEKLEHENNHLKLEHLTLSDYLVRLARSLSWSECSSPPSPGHDTTILADTLLERAERLTAFHEAHGHGEYEKHSWEHVHSAPHHSHHLPKLRREKSCHDIPLKESINVYALQKRVRVLREQVQRRDLHLELLRRKLALVEDGARSKAILQTERDEALHRARKNSRHAERTTAQLIHVKQQLTEVKSQLVEAADYKITALERARKIDDLQSHITHLENEKSRLQSDLARCKVRARSVSESSAEKRVQNEATIAMQREEIANLKRENEQLDHRISHLQTFRHSVTRLVHIRDSPDSNVMHRLHILCNSLDDYGSSPKRFDMSSSPAGLECLSRPLSSSPIKHYSTEHYTEHSHHHHDHFDDDLKF